MILVLLFLFGAQDQCFPSVFKLLWFLVGRWMKVFTRFLVVGGVFDGHGPWSCFLFFAT